MKHLVKIKGTTCTMVFDFGGCKKEGVTLRVRQEAFCCNPFGVLFFTLDTSVLGFGVSL